MPMQQPGSTEKAGDIKHVAANAIPAGWLKANGAAVSRSAYSALFAVIGTTYGAGDGATTFNLPDLRGEFLRGFDDARGADAGRAIGSFQGDAIRNITGFGGSDLAYGYNGAFYAGGARANSGGTGSAVNDVMFDASRVVPTAADNRPRNVAMLAVIKY